MKKRQRKIVGLLLAGMLACLPASQAFAETEYEAAGAVDQVLFPEDSLIGVAGGLVLDGEALTPNESGTWVNSDKEKVYTATALEDGTIELKEAGYELVVEHGTVKTDKEDDRYHHYQFLDWEKPEEPTDRAYYEADEVVKLTADEPEEGMEFKGWKCEDEKVVIADPTSAETTLVMIDRKVTVTAEYQEKQPEELLPEEDDPAEETNPIEETDPVQVPEGDLTVDGGLTPEAGEGEGGGLIVIGEESEPEAISYTVTVNAGTVSGNFLPGEWITVSANDRSAENLQFAGWYVDTMNVSPDDLMAATTGFIMPEENVTITATYTEIPAADVPETDAPQTDAPAADVPEADTPQTDVPAADVPETDAPQTDAPAADVPETDAPQTDAPAADVPETDVPETDAPQTDAPADTVMKYTVEVENNGIGSGEYAVGEMVTVEALSELVEGEVFDSWQTSSDSLALTDPEQQVMTFAMPAEPVTLTPTYTAVYALNIADENVTAVLPENPDQSELSQLTEGTTVKVTAKDRSADGLKFESWMFETADGTALELSYETDGANTNAATFHMPASAVVVKAVYANAVTTYQVRVSNGLVTDTVTGAAATEMNCEANTKITVTANPSPTGQAFSHWVINEGQFDLGEAAYSQTIELTVDQPLNILAVYEGIQYTVTVEDGYSDYEECVGGTAVTITADEAPEGYEFDYWNVESQNASLADAYSEVTTFTMPLEDVTVRANYRQVAFKLTVENGSSSEKYYYAGDEVTVKSNYPASGRVFGKWEAVSGNVSFTKASRWKTTFIMPASDVKVRAAYKDGPSTNDNVILDLVEGGEYYVGDTLKFTASGAGMNNENPNPGDYRYRPTGYQIGNVNGTLQSPYSISMAINKTGEYTLKTTYNKDIFDGSNWIADGTTDTKTVTFRVVTKAAGVATGDDTPIVAVIAMAAVSCIVFLILLVVFLRRRRR